MPEYDFDVAEFEERRQRVREAMAGAGIELLLVVSPVNINYLIGCRTKGYQQFQVLFFPLDEEPLTFLTRTSELPETLDTCLAEDIRGWGGPTPEDPIEATIRLMEEKGYAGRRIGLEVVGFYLTAHEYEGLKDYLGPTLVKDATGLIDELKFIKSPAEIAYIRKAAAIADTAMDVCFGTVSDGMTEAQVAGEVYRSIMVEGGEMAASPMNFASGERTCYAHPAPSEKPIAQGDFMHIEYGTAYRRYCALLGRQLCLGNPAPRMVEIFDVVRAAGDAFIAEIKAGVPANKPHQAAKKVIAKAGMEKYRLHTTGYGIAPAFPPMWGERLDLSDDSPYLLQAGMVVSVEPPVFSYEDRLGARLVDTVLVTDQGGEVLSRVTRDLIVL